MRITLIVLVFTTILASPGQAATTRFCLEGEFDLGARYQGLAPLGGEFYSGRWCVVSDDETERVLFSATGKSNPDMDGDWTVAYLPPDLVRIVNRDSPPDIEFRPTESAEEARRVRRLDPRRLISEYRAHPERFARMTVDQQDGRLARIETEADLPLRGRVPVEWLWDWPSPDTPRARLRVDGQVMFRGIGRWETLDEATASEAFMPTPGADPVQVPGDNWPSRVAMQLVNLTDGVYLARGVRTGFRHMVVETSAGLVVGDAPAGWVELHQLPPSDLVPGLGISGLSEKLLDLLKQELPGRKIAAVALTHHHDDHAGGARAFAAEGAAVYAPAGVAAFLEAALNRPEMPPDRLGKAGLSVDVIPVAEDVSIGDGPNPVRLVPLGAGPHVEAMLGLWAVGADYFFVSDVHVPTSEAGAPTAARAETECWFAGRATELLPATTRIVNSHSAVVTSVQRLRDYLQSEACRQFAATGPE